MPDDSTTTHHRVCPVCEQDDARPWLAKERLRLVQCRRCAMVYASPVDPELASGKFYDRLAAPFYLSPDKLESDFAPVRFERELRLFRNFCERGRVLDVGCSTGAFLHQLRTRWPGAYDPLGTDVTGAALDHAESRGVTVVRAPFLQHDFGGALFDAICFWAVMEHLAEPKGFLRKAAALLRPGGVCFVLVPNLQSFAVRLLGAKYRYLMPDHLNYFTAATFRAFVAAEPAFEMVRLESTHFNPVVIWQDFRRAPARVSAVERARLLRRTTNWKQASWLRPLRAPYAGLEKSLGALRLADNLVAVLRRG